MRNPTSAMSLSFSSLFVLERILLQNVTRWLPNQLRSYLPCGRKKMTQQQPTLAKHAVTNSVLPDYERTNQDEVESTRFGPILYNESTLDVEELLFECSVPVCAEPWYCKVLNYIVSLFDCVCVGGLASAHCTDVLYLCIGYVGLLVYYFVSYVNSFSVYVKSCLYTFYRFVFCSIDRVFIIFVALLVYFYITFEDYYRCVMCLYVTKIVGCFDVSKKECIATAGPVFQQPRKPALEVARATTILCVTSMLQFPEDYLKSDFVNIAGSSVFYNLPVCIRASVFERILWSHDFRKHVLHRAWKMLRERKVFGLDRLRLYLFYNEVDGEIFFDENFVGVHTWDCMEDYRKSLGEVDEMLEARFEIAEMLDYDSHMTGNDNLGNNMFMFSPISTHSYGAGGMYTFVNFFFRTNPMSYWGVYENQRVKGASIETISTLYHLVANERLEDGQYVYDKDAEPKLTRVGPSVKIGFVEVVVKVTVKTIAKEENTRFESEEDSLSKKRVKFSEGSAGLFLDPVYMYACFLDAIQWMQLKFYYLVRFHTESMIDSQLGHEL